LEIAEHDIGAKPSWTMELELELARLVECLSGNEAVDPAAFYDALASTTTLDSHQLGDAVTALRVLLYTIKTASSNKALRRILHISVTEGSLQQTMTGERLKKGRMVRRTKVKKQAMSCPFAVPGDCSTLLEALAKATVEPQSVQGLDWDHISDYQEEERKELGNDEKEWTTTKTAQLASLPRHLLLHLQRFRFENDTVALLSSEVDVPETLDMTAYTTDNMRSCCLQYQLTGAILHVSDSGEETGGHYVALIRTSDARWFLLDDDNVMPLKAESVLDFVSGRPTKMDESYCATVLAFSRTCECSDTVPLFCELRLEAQSNLIGKRLRIRWKSGKYYSGVIESYNEESGKHSIEYDDGDVREYTLSKKIIQWIE
jgi:hypothetical protein